MAVTSYFFDTNFLFKAFFNTKSLEECELKDYLGSDSGKFISKNVEYEFSNIFLEFSNRINHYLIAPYYALDDDGKFTLEDYRRMTESLEILKYNSDAVSAMIWKCICRDKKSLSKSQFRRGLKGFILDFNQYFHFKYNHLTGQMTVHTRLERYEKTSKILASCLHRADLEICLDAHDVALRMDIDNLAFVTADKSFINNSKLIVENTKIDRIIPI